jgi:uncharacterized membrane protein YqgA involved in biofilm formation
MTGTIVNTVAILLGGLIGMSFGGHIPERFKTTVITAMGLFTGAMGLQMFLKTQNALIVLGALVIGSMLGEWWRIEDRMHTLGAFLEKRFAHDDSEEGSDRFIRGFLTASILFCTGPMAILGSIQDGLTGDFNLLAVKSVLDGLLSLAFASTLGLGVLFSSLMILLYQGGISLLAVQLSTIVTDPMIAEMSATGGVILMGLALSSFLEVKKIRVGNFIPALFIAPLIVWILSLFP